MCVGQVEYCGRCHDWTDTVMVCACPEGPDDSKDPNCHNSGHDHHDPESPIVLARKAEYAAEEEAEASRILPLEELAEDVEIVREQFEIVDGTPSLDDLAELDEILEETNRQEDSECLLAGHNWVRMGRVGLTESGLSGVDWEPVECMRCGEPAPKEKCLVHTYATGALFCDKCGHLVSEIQSMGFVNRDGPTDRPGGEFKESVGGPHACPGCNLRDLTMKDALEHIRRLQVVVFDMVQVGTSQEATDTRRDAAAFLRMSENRIHAAKEED